VAQYAWYWDKVGNVVYAATDIPKIGKVKMHQLILGKTIGRVTDHINFNGLDNRRCNLRVVSSRQNTINRRLQRNNTSGYRGVEHRHGKWNARIKCRGKTYHLGTFADAESAARVYDKAAQEFFGSYAQLNSPAVKEPTDDAIG
jgi:hypothetical protein